MNNTCGKTMHTGTMDKGFAVYHRLYVAFIDQSVIQSQRLCNVSCFLNTQFPVNS
jgi:hypothetical protein